MCVGSQTPSQSALPITSLRCSNAEPWPNTLVLCAQTSCWSGPRACGVCHCCWREPQPCSSRGPTTRGAMCAASSPRSSCPCSLWWLPWAWGHSGPRRLSTLSCCCLPPCMARLTRQTSLGECCSSGPCSEPFSWGQNEPFGVILSTAAVLHVAHVVMLCRQHKETVFLTGLWGDGLAQTRKLQKNNLSVGFDCEMSEECYWLQSFSPITAIGIFLI